MLSALRTELREIAWLAFMVGGLSIASIGIGVMLVQQ
jgi:hypothetical protein